MPNLDKLAAIAKKHANLAAVAIALGALGVAISDDDPERETKLVSLGDALAKGEAPRRQQTAKNLDTGKLHSFELQARAACPGSYGLGGALVKLGATYEAGGNFDPGMRLVAWEDCCVGELGGRYDAATKTCLTVPDAASWTVLGSSCEDRDDATWCEVRLRNDGKEPQRPIVFVRRAP